MIQLHRGIWGAGEELFTTFDPEIPGQRIYSNEIME